MIVEKSVKDSKESLEKTLGSVKSHKEMKKIVDVDNQVVINFIDSFEEACRLHVEEMKKELLGDFEVKNI